MFEFGRIRKSNVFPYLCLLGTIIIFIVFINDYNRSISGVSSLNIFNDTVKSLSLILTSTIGCCESIVQHKYKLQFWLLEKQLENDCIQNVISDVKLRQKRKYSRMYVIYLMVTIVLELLILVRIENDGPWVFNWSIRIGLFMAIRIMELEYIFYLEILFAYLEYIRQQIHILVNKSELHEPQLSDIKGLHLYKRMYFSVYEMSSIVNKSYGLSQLSVIILSFIQLSTDLFLIYLKMSTFKPLNVPGEHFKSSNWLNSTVNFLLFKSYLQVYYPLL